MEAAPVSLTSAVGPVAQADSHCPLSTGQTTANGAKNWSRAHNPEFLAARACAAGFFATPPIDDFAARCVCERGYLR